MTTSASSPQPRAQLLAYLQLMRAPNVFTAVADILMGFLVTSRSFAQWPGLVLLAVSSASLYLAGMVWNDICDLEVDRVERPRRPLPSGRISLAAARRLGTALLGIGLLAGAAAGPLTPTALGSPWRSGAVALGLAGLVLAYDLVAKQTWCGPWAMGSCRFANVLLGMSLNAAVSQGVWSCGGYGACHLCIAAGIGLYIVGVTYFARGEAATSPRLPLVGGIVVMVAGIAVLALFPRFAPLPFVPLLEPRTAWPLGVTLVSIWILRRALIAVGDPSAPRVQAAVKQCIFSLVVLDALVSSLAVDWQHSVIILALLAPMLLLGRWVYST